MNPFKNFFENKIVHSPNKGDNQTAASSEKMRKLDVKLEDEPVNEQTVEKIEKSFADIFSKDANRDVVVYSQKKERDVKIGAYLNNAFFDKNALHILQEMFIARNNKRMLSDADDIEAQIKQFCLENIEDINCNSEEMKSAIRAVCTKETVHGDVGEDEIEKVDEKLQADIEAAWDSFCDLSEEFKKKIEEDRIVYGVDAVDFFKEEVKKSDQLNSEVNGRIGSDGSIAKYDDEVKDFFQNHIEKIKKLKEEYREGKKKFKKIGSTPEPASESVVEPTPELTPESIPETVPKSNNLERCLDYVERTAAARKVRLEKGELVGDLKIEDVNIKKIENKVDEIDALKKRIDEINVEFAKIKKEQKRKEKKTKDVKTEKKSVVPEKKEGEIEKLEDGKDKNEAMAVEFKKAAGLIEYSSLTKDEFEKKFNTKLLVEIADFDVSKNLLYYADIIVGHHNDAITKEEQEKFWENYQSFVDYVGQINDAENSEKLVVIEGCTYAVNKENTENTLSVEENANTEVSSEVDIEDEKKVENNNFEIALELVRDFRGKLSDSLKGNEGWEKRRKQYQESFLEGEMVAFLDELIEQEKIVSEDEREAFVSDVLKNL